MKKFAPRRFTLQRRGLKDDQSAVAFTFVVGVASIFITIVVWYLLTGPLDTILDVAENIAPLENTLGIGTETRSTIWNLLPIMVVLGIIIWMFVRSQKEIYGTGYV